jgi:DNA-binding NarL/FixJ family response regulator
MKINVAIGLVEAPLVLRVRRYLEGFQEFKVSEAYQSIDELRKGLCGKHPSVVLLDDSMFLAASRSPAVVQEMFQTSKLLLFCKERSEQLALTAVRFGVSGCLFQELDNSILVDSIRHLANGRSVLSPHIAGTFTEILRAFSTHKQRPYRLTAREFEALHGVDLSHPNPVADLAQKTGLHQNTVRVHLSNATLKVKAVTWRDAAKKIRLFSSLHETWSA